MDRLFDWLATPAGAELAHAVVLLISAFAAILAARAGRRATEARDLMDGHLEAHLASAISDPDRSAGEAAPQPPRPETDRPSIGGTNPQNGP